MKIKVEEFYDGYSLTVDGDNFNWRGKSVEVAQKIGEKITEHLIKNREKLIKNIDNG